MFGRAFFGGRYYGPRYFGDGPDAVIAPPVAGGPALPPRIIFIQRPRAVFACVGQGGIFAGGAAETSLHRVPARAYAFQGRARGRLAGRAKAVHFDMGAHIRRLDDELLLMA